MVIFTRQEYASLKTYEFVVLLERVFDQTSIQRSLDKQCVYTDPEYFILVCVFSTKIEYKYMRTFVFVCDNVISYLLCIFE